MKTITNGIDILRVNESEADSKVKNGWKFTTKGEWKEKVRDFNKQEKTENKKEKKLDISKKS